MKRLSKKTLDRLSHLQFRIGWYPVGWILRWAVMGWISTWTPHQWMMKVHQTHFIVWYPPVPQFDSSWWRKMPAGDWGKLQLWPINEQKIIQLAGPGLLVSPEFRTICNGHHLWENPCGCLILRAVFFSFCMSCQNILLLTQNQY